MKKSIDELSIELTKELALESLNKTALPPKLAYRWHRWMQKMKAISPKHLSEKTKKTEGFVFAEASETESLNKNEALASFYDSGVVKLDFGPEVDPELKKAAMKWAQKKGLKAIETTLQKSKDQFQTIIFSDDEKKEHGECVKIVKITSN